MKALFKSAAKIQQSAINAGLSELILQENAAFGVANLVREKLARASKIVFLCGGGNNGADAIAAARMLACEYECELFFTSEKLCQNARIQLQIALSLGVKKAQNLSRAQCYVDGIVGSGLNRELDANLCELIGKINTTDALKIAIDFPSGLDDGGRVRGACFEADFCLSMGALKLGLFSDVAKDYVGVVRAVNLGFDADFCRAEAQDFLLEKSDLRLPFRLKKNVNKGDFGHAFIALGQMSGAGILSALAALNLGAGKVSVVGDARDLDPQIMQKTSFEGASAVGLGMGLGGAKLDFDAICGLPCVIDADMCYRADARKFTQNACCVFTPHPKEFAALCGVVGLGELSTQDVLRDKFDLAREFSLKFASTLVLKGANTLIAHSGAIYVCDLGSARLAVAGSGDVLAGAILAYLAQGFSAKDAAINGVLAHALSAAKYHGNDYSLTPRDIIGGFKRL